MPIIHVAKRFVLQGDDHKLTEYKVGTYDVEDWVADHWFTQAHMEGYVEPPPKTGTEQQATLLAQQAARLNEPVENQTQEAQQSRDKPEFVFAGRRIPKQNETPSFIDPSTQR